jgi:predicted kinase
MVGLPGSGKSTYARDARFPVLSSDAIRLILADDETDQTIHGRVFATLRYLLVQRVEIGRPVTCIDATHLTRTEREPYVKIAKEHRCSLEAVFVNTPLAVCLERNRQRARRVPEEALIAMAAKLQPPMLEEGFARIEVI